MFEGNPNAESKIYRKPRISSYLRACLVVSMVKRDFKNEVFCMITSRANNKSGIPLFAISFSLTIFLVIYQAMVKSNINLFLLYKLRPQTVVKCT